MNRKNILVYGVLLLFAQEVFAQGFSSDYKVWSGDHNSDGRTDFLIAEQQKIIVISSDIIIPIVLPPSVAPFILQRNSDESYLVVATDSNVDTTVWQPADIDLHSREANFDDAVDLVVAGLDSVDSTAVEQLILASKQKNEIPMQASALTDDAVEFQTQVASWAWNHDYFEENAPTTAVQQPPTAQWFGAVFNPSNFFSVNRLLAQCELSTGNECGASFQDPSVCIVVVSLYDALGNFIGIDTINVCLIGALHIYSFLPGSVTIVKDYSVFNQDALAFVNRILSVSPDGLAGLSLLSFDILEQLNIDLYGIIITIFGERIFGDDNDGSDPVEFNFNCNFDNSGFHTDFPGDDTFDATDPTFHHYDVHSTVCHETEAGCSTTTLENDVLPLFSYPSFKLRPKSTPLDGSTNILVYVSINPFKRHDPEAYTTPFGFVTQSVLSAGSVWDGAIENVTRPAHVVFPGNIFRKIKNSGTQSGLEREIFTHGIGLNQVIDQFLEGDGNPATATIQFLLGCANDVFGADAFETLDRETIKYWKDLASGTQQAQIPEPASVIGQ